MKAARSKRSRRLWIAVLTVAVAMSVGNVAYDARGQLPHWIGNLATCAWLALFLAYFTSRLNDSWDVEARQRRASARQDVEV